MTEVKQLKQKLMIATPYYELKGYAPYIRAMLDTAYVLFKGKVEFEYMDLCGDSYVERAKNTIMNRFGFYSDASDLLIIDSDLHWNPDGLVKLLRSPFEVTGGTFPCKNNWESFPCCVLVNDDLTPRMDVKTGMIEADWVPGGFVKYKKSVCQKFAEAYPDDWYTDPSADPGAPADRKYYNFFSCGIDNNHLRYGEDVGFCAKWKKLGGKIYIQPDIDFSHYGVQGWKGNYDKFLKKCPKPQQAPSVDISDKKQDTKKAS